MALESGLENVNKALKRVDAFDETAKKKNVETVGSLKNQIFDPIDNKFQPENIRSESIDPRMLAYDSGIPQLYIEDALVECNIGGNVNDVSVGSGKISITNWKGATLSRWGIKEFPREDYDPTRTWIVEATDFTLPTSGGYFLYAKLNLANGSTACMLEVSTEHREVKLYIEDGFLYYKLGFISTPVDNVRYAEMLWGNVKPTPAAAKPIQITGLALLSTGWTLNGTSELYEYTLENANITATSSVEVVPVSTKANIALVVDAVVYPETESSAGSVLVVAENEPTGDIDVSIIITEVEDLA